MTEKLYEEISKMLKIFKKYSLTVSTVSHSYPIKDDLYNIYQVHYKNIYLFSINIYINYIDTNYIDTGNLHNFKDFNELLLLLEDIFKGMEFECIEFKLKNTDIFNINEMMTELYTI